MNPALVGMLTRTVVIERRTLGVRDGDGIELVTFVSDAPILGYLEFSSSAEATPGEIVSSNQGLLVLDGLVSPPGPDDRVVVDDERLTVVGPARKWVDPTIPNSDHWEITVAAHDPNLLVVT